MNQPFKFRNVNQIVGLFVVLALLLLVTGIVLAGKAQRWFQPSLELRVRFPAEGTLGVEKGAKIVILGAGGAARAVSVELSLAGAGSITIVNRPEDAALAKSLMELLSKIMKNNSFVTWDHTYQVPADTDILVNATPIGLYPNVDEIPNIDLDTILPSMFVQDVIPNPAITPFLRAAEARGARWNTGTGMLINQAAINIELWTGLKPDKKVMLKALEEALS